MRVLGTPLGHVDYVQTQLTQKLAEHDVLLQRIPLVTDVQSAWSLLLHCAGGRANYLLRVVRPELVGRFALGHNEGLWECLKRIMKLEGDVRDTVKDITSLPLALGGLGLRSATRTSESAFWASWADSLAMIRERHLTVAAAIVGSLERSVDMSPTLASVARARHHISGPGKPWFKEPARQNANRMILNQEEQGLDGNTKRRQGQNCSSEAASWPLWPSTSRPCSGHRVDLLLERPSQLLRPPGSPGWIPTSSECSSPGGSVSLSLSLHACVDAAVPWTSLATIALRVRERGSWDGGGFQWRVWQRASAEKEGPEWQPISWSEIWISGRPTSLTAGGLKWLPTGCLCLEACSWPWTPRWCLLCIVTAQARRHTAHVDGAVLEVARRKKEATYPELVAPRARARLVVWAGEVNGRWSEETRTFLSLLAKAKARSETPVMRRRVEQAWRMRWGAMLACTAARAFAASLLNLRLGGGVDGEVPTTQEVVNEARYAGLRG